MASIYLIRHGQASFGAADYDQLSDTGFKQAEHLGHALNARSLNINHVICGGMKRHQQTAERCLGQFNHSPSMEIDVRWNEYDHENILDTESRSLGFASTQDYLCQSKSPKSEFETLFVQATQHWMQNTHGDYTESYEQFKNRLDQALNHAREKLAEIEGNILVFTSGGPISYTASRLLNAPESNFIHLNWTLCNTGITKIVQTKQRTLLASLNEQAHLEGQDKSLITYR